MINTHEKEFLNLLKKEKELEKAQKLHAEKAITSISKTFEEEEKNATLIQKIGWNIKDYLSSFKLKKIKRKHDKKVKKLTKEDKEDKLIQEKTYKMNGIILRIFFKRYFDRCRLSDDCGTIDISDIRYIVGITLECNSKTSKNHRTKKFVNEEDALNYFNTLTTEYKNKQIKTILTQLSADINTKIKNLNEQ